MNDSGKSIAEIPAASPDAARAYEKAADRLLDHVNRALEKDPQIRELIGGNPFELMRNNHSNHAAFMTTVFKLNAYELLVRTLPWVYRAYHARGFSYDYFPLELTAWKQAVEQTLDGIHSAEIIRIYDWMIDHHENAIRLSESGAGLAFSLPGETTEMQEMLLSLLLHSDSRGCLQLVQRSVLTKDDLRHFFLDVVCPVMYRIGLLWERNEISVAEEHLATAMVGRISAALYSRFANVEVSRGKVLVTAGPNEFHETGARMLADFLELEGWDVTFLGANTPGEEILAFLRRHKPFLLALSVATVFNLDQARQVIEMIRKDRDTKGIKIMVGGLALNGMPSLWRDFGADGYAADAAQAVRMAGTWWQERAL